MTSLAKIMPAIDSARCNGCGLCVERCPAGALDLRDGCVVMARPDLCSYCATCEDVCPTQAIALPYQIVLAPDSDRL